MSNYDDNSLFFFDHPLVPSLSPLLGATKLWEQESDYRYLNYLYPAIAREIMAKVEETCDQLEYEGSPMFDEYPDREFFRQKAREIYRSLDRDDPLLRDLVEVLLFHEIIYRRNRYRNRKRLYL